MNKLYLGIDIGSISTKCVVINKDNKIIAKDYIMTEGNPINAVKKILSNIKKDIRKEDKIISIGTTGSARYLIGKMLNASITKNEITAHAVGTISEVKDVRTILEIGGQDSKIIIINNGIVIDYAMNTLCAAGTGAFLSSQARRLGIDVKDMGTIAINAKQATKIAARCTVFAETDLVHKLQTGHSKEEIVKGLCQSIVDNYLINVGKGKKILPPIVFQGGVSKNIGVKKAFEKALNEEVIVLENSHLLGALGIALLAKKTGIENEFNFDIINNNFTTHGKECNNCPNHCEIIYFKSNNKLIDVWGNKCEKGKIIK